MKVVEKNENEIKIFPANKTKFTGKRFALSETLKKVHQTERK